MRAFSLLLAIALLHLLLATAFAIALSTTLPSIAGEHPALKPMKFGVSIAVLLASVAVVLRGLDAPAALRDGIGMILAVAMLVEMVAIAGQALRGQSSHFNTSTSFDTVVWAVMGIAIVIALLALAVLAVVALTHDLRFSPLVAFAIRAGLCVMLLVAVSGFAMAGGHHRDLRVAHFFAIHGLQVLPLVAIVVLRIPVGERVRWAAVLFATVVWVAAAIAALGVGLARHP